MTDPSADDFDGTLDHAAEWAAVHTLFAECLKEPTETFVEEVRAGRLSAELAEYEDALGLSLSDPDPPEPTDRGALQTGYLRLFEAMEQPYAPPAESPYKPWYGSRDGGLLGGPSATDMEQRFEALGAEPPAAYPADHVALLLEYGALLLEAGEIEQYRNFLTEHLDWIPALEGMVEDAAAEAPFYRWAVRALDETLTQLRGEMAVEEPPESTVEEMQNRIDATTDPEDRDRGFQPSDPSGLE